jgi:hypothetical protein
MASFKTLAAVVLLSATAATPAFAQAAIQEPGLFSFYYPNLEVLNGGIPTPAATLSRDWPALRGPVRRSAQASLIAPTGAALMLLRLTYSLAVMAAAVTRRDHRSSRFVESA